MADQGGLCEGATEHATTRYVIYFVHDLHGYLDGIPGGGLRRMGGVKAIAQLLKGWKKTDWQQGQIDGVFVCLGGDMVCEYRSRKLDKSNVKKVWEYILKEMSPDAWVLGNHELDPEYADSLLEMIGCSPETCCTRNLLWADSPEDCPLKYEICPHQDEPIPPWSQHVLNGAADPDAKPIVFTGLTVAKAGWGEDGYRKIADRHEFTVKKHAQERDWKKLCKRFVEEWRRRTPIYVLIRNCMSGALVAAIQAVSTGASRAITDNHQKELVDLSNKMLHNKGLTKKKVSDLADSEVWSLNAAFLRPVFSPALVCTQRHRFRVLDPERLIDRVKRKPCKEGCQRCKNGSLHVHLAHFSDAPPEKFGSSDGPWLKSGPGFGLPAVSLKAHDHCVSPDSDETQGGEGQTQRIPTFEAGRNGAVFGKLKLTVTPSAPKCDWQTLYTGKAIDFEEREFPRIGVGPNGNAGSYPIVAQGLDFARMGGSPFESDELYRAVTLLLRSASYRCQDGQSLVVASPSLVIADSRIEESDLANGGTIDLFDIGHVFGHREQLHTVSMSSEGELANGILDALGSAHLGANPLPPMSGGLPVPGHGTWADALPYWYLPEAMCPPNVAVGRVLCLRWKKKEYLVVSPPVSKKEEIDRKRTGLYELRQNGDKYKPVFECRLSGQTIDTLAEHLEIEFPLTICIDRWLAKRCGWYDDSSPVEDGRLMQIVAAYIRNCADSERGLWRP